MATHTATSAAAFLAADVARRDPHRLAAAMTDDVRLRALLPGGPIQAHGRENVAALLCALLADFDPVRVVRSAGEQVADRLHLHYRLELGRGTTRWVCTQTAVVTTVEDRLSAIDLLCSGFLEIEDDENLPAPSGATRIREADAARRGLLGETSGLMG